MKKLDFVYLTFAQLCLRRERPDVELGERTRRWHGHHTGTHTLPALVKLIEFVRFWSIKVDSFGPRGLHSTNKLIQTNETWKSFSQPS